jgi:hypothetical protein
MHIISSSVLACVVRLVDTLLMDATVNFWFQKQGACLPAVVQGRRAGQDHGALGPKPRRRRRAMATTVTERRLAGTPWTEDSEAEPRHEHEVHHAASHGVRGHDER